MGVQFNTMAGQLEGDIDTFLEQREFQQVKRTPQFMSALSSMMRTFYELSDISESDDEMNDVKHTRIIDKFRMKRWGTFKQDDNTKIDD